MFTQSGSGSGSLLKVFADIAFITTNTPNDIFSVKLIRIIRYFQFIRLRFTFG
jgi:hypothetical protein